MKVDFKKIKNQSYKFSIEKENIIFSGEFRKNRDFVDIKGKIQKDLSIICDRCGKEFMLKLDEDILLKASDGAFRGNIEDCDVVEFYDGFIDFDEILESEIESIKLDYHLCEQCKKDEDFEIEI